MKYLLNFILFMFIGSDNTVINKPDILIKVFGSKNSILWYLRHHKIVKLQKQYILLHDKIKVPQTKLRLKGMRHVNKS